MPRTSSFCNIHSPIDGKIDRRMIDVGNQGDRERHHADYQCAFRKRPDVRQFRRRRAAPCWDLRLRRQKKEIKSARDTKQRNWTLVWPTKRAIRSEATIDYAANFVDTGTGTLCAFDSWSTTRINCRTLSGRHVRSRACLWIGDPTPSVLVPEAALVSDQGVRHLFVVNEKDEVEYRPVQIGLQQGDMRVIKSGVTAKDRVIVSGLQRVRAGIKVAATEQPDKIRPATAAAGKETAAVLGAGN